MADTMTQRRDLDLSDPAIFTAGVPHEVFDYDRAHQPVRWVDATPRRGIPEGDGFWSVTRYATARTITANPQLFSSRAGGVRMETYGTDYLEFERRMLLLMDPPEQVKMRQLVSKHFVPRTVEKLRARVDELSREAVERVLARGDCDFILEVAAEVPLLVIADLLGIDREDRAQFKAWSDTIAHAADPQYTVSSAAYRRAFDELLDYGRRVVTQKRRDPGDDLISALAHSELEGAPLSDVQLVMFWYLLLIAGNETSRNALGGALLAFAQHRDQRERLTAAPALLASAVEEVLRYVSPVLHLRRTAVHDAELEGRRIRAGDKVVLWLAAANRDPEVFPSPHRFDIGRHPNEHMAFGFGTHFCLGAHLARLEIQSVLAEVFRRIPNYEIRDVERVESNFIQAFRHLRIAFGPENSGN